MDLPSKTSLEAKYLDVCRCCLKEDLGNISKEYFISVEKEMYVKMLEDTFNIQLSLHNFIDNRNICNTCIDKLCDAELFKKQVLEAELTLSMQYERMLQMICDDSKQEIDDVHYDNDIKSMNVLDTTIEFKDGEDSLENDTSYKKISNKELVIKAKPKKAIDEAPRAKKKNAPKDSLKVKKAYSKIPASTKRVKKKISVKKSEKEKPRSKKSIEKPTSLVDFANDLHCRKNNTLNLITNSNMCVFISKKTKFKCYSCSDVYLDIKQLREHSKTHFGDRILKININRCRGLSYKHVDISNLTCNICSDPCDSLNDLRDHLTSKHDVIFNSDKHLLVPFKLEEGFKCVICDAKFMTFFRLSIHMNTHATDNVCEICGIAYINRVSLRAHLSSMHREKKCTKCSAVLPTSSAKVKHMRKAHNTGFSKRYCMLCNMTFRYTYLLKQHTIDMHGAKHEVSDCEHCSKRFLTVAGLRVHMRFVHIGERNYPCSICEMRFPTSHDKNRHERTHGVGKPVSCDFCEVKFKSKDSMRRHLKRQHQKPKLAN